MLHFIVLLKIVQSREVDTALSAVCSVLSETRGCLNFKPIMDSLVEDPIWHRFKNNAAKLAQSVDHHVEMLYCIF